MDSKTFRLSILAIITTVVLIGVVVYAANRDKINSMIAGSKTEEAAESSSEEEAPSTEFGEQIGDNLKAFLTAGDFFDKSEQRPSVVVVVDNVPVPANSDMPQGVVIPSDSDIPENNERPVKIDGPEGATGAGNPNRPEVSAGDAN